MRGKKIGPLLVERECVVSRYTNSTYGLDLEIYPNFIIRRLLSSVLVLSPNLNFRLDTIFHIVCGCILDFTEK